MMVTIYFIDFSLNVSYVQGIFEPVTLGNHVLGPWKMIAYPLNETSWLSTIEPHKRGVLPAFYKTTFTLPDNLSKPLDTYLDPTGWKKVGFFIINYNRPKIIGDYLFNFMNRSNFFVLC